jgi:hypothetical protein
MVGDHMGILGAVVLFSASSISSTHNMSMSTAHTIWWQGPTEPALNWYVEKLIYLRLTYCNKRQQKALQWHSPKGR